MDDLQYFSATGTFIYLDETIPCLNITIAFWLFMAWHHRVYKKYNDAKGAVAIHDGASIQN